MPLSYNTVGGLPHSLPLVDDHQTYLEKRGVSSQWAMGDGFKSVHEARKLLNRKKKVGSGFVIPYPHVAGHLVVRLDFPRNPGEKFCVPTDSKVQPYLPPMLSHVWRDVTVPLVIVEGPIKSLSLAFAGIPAIGLGGVSVGGHNVPLRRDTKVSELHPLLIEQVAWAGRKVTVMFDAETRPDVLKNILCGENIMAEALTRAGAIALVARTPSSPENSKQGPDDFLVAAGAGAVISHLATATPWEPPKAPRGDWPSWSPQRGLELAAFGENRFHVGSRVQARDLYLSYRLWCDANAIQKHLSEHSFFRHLPDFFRLAKTSSRGSKFWIRLD